MPYQIETTKLNQRFLSATQIAILLSLGLHWLIYKYGFPVALFAEKSNRDPMVSTVELSPLEQARLPDLEAQWNVPQLQNTPLDEAAPPFALPLPPNFNPSTDLPPVSIPPGYSFPPIPSISSNIELPPLGITDLSALPLPPPLEDLDSLVPPNAPLTTPEATEPEKTEEAIAPPPKPESKPEETTEDKPTPEQIAAVREQKLKGDIRAVSKSLKKENGATNDEEARKNYVAWLSKIEDVEPESLEIKGVYPKDACIRKLEGKSVYGAVVDENNRVVALDLIKGAEYPLFNEKAGEDIQKHDFGNDTQKPKPYQVTVDYQYDAEICPSLTLPSLEKKEETAPKPEGKTQPPSEETPSETKPDPEAQPSSEETPSETKPDPEAQPSSEETPSETKPDPEAQPSSEETPSETKPSLRERLQNTPLPDNDTIRERLRKNPLPEK